MGRFGVNLIWVALRDYLPDGKQYAHDHPYYHYICFLKGEGDIQIGQEHFSFEPGKIYLTPPEITHAFRSKGNAPLITIELKFTIPDPELDQSARALPYMIDMGGSVPRHLVACMLQEMERKKAYSSEILEAQLFELLHYLLRQSQTDSDCDKAAELEPVLRYIHENLSREITLADLAEAAHLEKTYFTKKFKRLTGTSPMQYVRNARIEKAMDLLAYSDSTITQIAAEMGFQSIHHFSNLFLKYTGVSPRKYKNAHTAPENQ